MNCVIVPAEHAAVASTPSNCDTAARFSELVRTEPSREVFYVDGPAKGSDTNPVMRAMSEFQSAEFKMPGSHGSQASDETAPRNGDPEYSELDRLVEMGQDALLVQAQILRTTLMMETVNAGKQGVTTLFQQQG